MIQTIHKVMSFFIALTFVLITFLLFGSNTVNASDQADSGKTIIGGIDDGIYNWKKQNNILPGSYVGSKSIIPGQLSLNYTFGKSTSGNQQISAASIPNIFLEKTDSNGLKTDINTLFQFSTSSVGFEVILDKDENVASGTSLRVSSNMANRAYYTGTDADGNMAMKMVGDYTGYASYSKFQFRVETLLRVSPSKAPIIQREMYILNNSDGSRDYGVLYGEDTQLNQNDNIPIKDLGNKSGLYMEDNDYKLSVSNNVPDGFTSYKGERFDNVFGFGVPWTNGFSPADFSGTGDEVGNHKYGDILYNDDDSSYVVKWPFKSIAKGEVQHFASGMGAVARGQAIPDSSKTYVNETSKDGKNHVGDKLKFKINLENDGYKSKYALEKVIDQIPEGLQVDPNSIKFVDSDGNSHDMPASDFDAKTKTLNVPTEETLDDGKTLNITFDATILMSASGQTLTNVADIYGDDESMGDSYTTLTPKVDIPVEKSTFDYAFTQQVKNVSKGEDYSNETSGKSGETIGYKINYQVTADSIDSLNAGAKIKDSLPEGLTLDGNVTVNYSNGTSTTVDSLDDISLDKLAVGDQVTIEYKTKLTKNSAGILNNQAVIDDVKSSAGLVLNGVQSSDAILNVENTIGFSSVPSLIDFGNVVLIGHDRTADNVATKGQLSTNHPTSDNYQVKVSYSNTSPTGALKDSSADNLPSKSGDGVLFIKQKTNSPHDPGTWKPLDSSGVPIESGYFNGNQNLTDYIGVGQWELKLNQGTKPGWYKGAVTWSMIDAPE